MLIITRFKSLCLTWCTRFQNTTSPNSSILLTLTQELHFSSLGSGCSFTVLLVSAESPILFISKKLSSKTFLCLETRWSMSMKCIVLKKIALHTLTNFLSKCANGDTVNSKPKLKDSVSKSNTCSNPCPSSQVVMVLWALLTATTFL